MKLTKNIPPDVRFDARVDRSAGPDGCWPWTGVRLPRGYGFFSVDGRNVYTHRYALERATGPLAAGEVARHKCDNPSCCNPAHLERGSQSENIRDAVARRRWPRSRAFGKAQAVLS